MKILAAKIKTYQQWRSKALRGPGSTVSYRSSVVRPKGLKLEDRSAGEVSGLEQSPSCQEF